MSVNVGSALRGFQNRLNTMATMARTGDDASIMMRALRRDALKLQPHVGSSPSYGVFRTHLRDNDAKSAIDALHRSADELGVKLQTRRGASHVGSSGAASTPREPVGYVDGHYVDELGNTPRGTGRGWVGNDGAGFGHDGSAVDSSPGFNDYSDIF